MSQLLLRLERELESATDPVLRAELGARIAGNLARMGRFDEATQKIDGLRQTFGAGQSGRASVWIMLAEGLVHLFRDLSPQALDRITRAQLLGSAMNYSTFVALSSAWKANLEFDSSNFDAMAKSLNLVYENAKFDEHDARARAAIVLYSAFAYCGNRVAAQKWFMLGREHALKNGDQASVEALLHNRAAHTLSWLRAENCLRSIDASELHAIRMEMDSARNLQQLTGISALGSHIPLWEARLQVLEGQFERARVKLQAIRGQVPFAKYNFSQDFVDLEIAFCLLNSGGTEDALKLVNSLDSVEFGELDVDERLAAAWMLWQMALADPRFGAPDALFARVETLRTEYESSRDGLAQILAGFAEA